MPEQSHVPEPGLAAYAELLTRLTATSLVVIYGVGFVILAVHEAHYGILQFSPLRARIFLVGFVFIVLAVLPAAAHHYGLSHYGPLKSVLDNSDPTLERYRRVVLGSGFVFTAYWMAVAFSFFLFQYTPPVQRPHPWLRQAEAGGSYALLLLAYSLIGRRFARHPKASATCAVIVSLAFLAGQYGFGIENVADLTLWFFVAASAVTNARRFAGLRHALDFRNWIFIILTISLYISSVFGSMRSELGGGAPAPVVLYLERPVVLLDSTAAQVALLDETDQGFYVLPAGKNKALLVPRGDVRSIYFGPSIDAGKPK
jgi:hypothetical protein